MADDSFVSRWLSMWRTIAKKSELTVGKPSPRLAVPEDKPFPEPYIEPLEFHGLQTEKAEREKLMFDEHRRSIHQGMQTDYVYERMWDKQIHLDQDVHRDVSMLASMLSMVVADYESSLNTLTDTNVF